MDTNHTIQEAIDNGVPCYGYHLNEAPVYYVINGYDKWGYHVKGVSCEDGSGPKVWEDVGEDWTGSLEMCIVKPIKAATDEQIIKESLEFVLEHGKSKNTWSRPEHRTGLAGYELWMNALEHGEADGFGMALNILFYYSEKLCFFNKIIDRCYGVFGM